MATLERAGLEILCMMRGPVTLGPPLELERVIWDQTKKASRLHHLTKVYGDAQREAFDELEGQHSYVKESNYVMLSRHATPK